MLGQAPWTLQGLVECALKRLGGGCSPLQMSAHHLFILPPRTAAAAIIRGDRVVWSSPPSFKRAHTCTCILYRGPRGLLIFCETIFSEGEIIEVESSIWPTLLFQLLLFSSGRKEEGVKTLLSRWKLHGVDYYYFFIVFCISRMRGCTVSYVDFHIEKSNMGYRNGVKVLRASSCADAEGKMKMYTTLSVLWILGLNLE